MIFKEIIHYSKQATHEEILDEDLWEDGELNLEDVQSKVFRFLDTGHYMLIRRKDE